jgi:hypothetical protein
MMFAVIVGAKRFGEQYLADAATACKQCSRVSCDATLANRELRNQDRKPQLIDFQRKSSKFPQHSSRSICLEAELSQLSSGMIAFLVSTDPECNTQHKNGSPFRVGDHGQQRRG